MFQNDMDRKMQFSMDKVKRALEKGNGHTILSTGITGDDARMAKAVVDAGVSMLEPNHPALALARGYKGVTSMHEAEKIRHEITVSQMAEVTRGVRSVVGNDVYITVGIPGGFTEILPTPLTDEDFLMMSRSGADGLHTHKSSLHDLEQLVQTAHRWTLRGCIHRASHGFTFSWDFGRTAGGSGKGRKTDGGHWNRHDWPDDRDEL